MKNSRNSVLEVLALVLLATLATLATGEEPTRQSLFETFDLDLGEAVVSRGGNKITLVSVDEPKGEVWGEISRPEVTVSVDGVSATLVAGMYRLPLKVPADGSGIQIDCPATGNLSESSHIDHWGLKKAVRLRVWKGDSPWVEPDSFGYPLEQGWFASHTAFSNEPVAPRPNRKLYYHAGLDLGGCEALTRVVAATDATVVSAGNRILPGHEPTNGSPVEPRYDVLYLLDDRGWYYRYSHLHSFSPDIVAGMKVKKGQFLGLLGKEGGSGGWTHLHFEIKNRQPSGEWGTEDAYAFIWQGYREIYGPSVIAVARPGHIVFEGDTVTHDGSRSWAEEASLSKYAWRFSDGTIASGPEVKKKYSEYGSYRETLEVTDKEGRIDFNFVRVSVFKRGEEGEAIAPPRLHAAFYPTLRNRAGEPVTFKVRAFGTTYGNETWDFGDGSEMVATKSDGNEVQLAPDGYAVVTHTYSEPGNYLVYVHREDENGAVAEDRLFVRVTE